MSAVNSAYVDTNILVSYALGPMVDQRFRLVEGFFNDVINGKYLVVVSNFALQEAIHTFRNIAIDQLYKELNEHYSKAELWTLVKSQEFRQEVNDRSMKAFRTIIDIITSDPKHFKIGDLSTFYPEKLFHDGLNLLTMRMGDIKVYPHCCRKCSSTIVCDDCGFDSEIVYKSINAPDVTHIIISGELGCKYFFTMEKDFGNVDQSLVKSKIVVLS
jgi:predicted nucleic acid-binding protein